MGVEPTTYAGVLLIAGLDMEHGGCVSVGSVQACATRDHMARKL